MVVIPESCGCGLKLLYFPTCPDSLFRMDQATWEVAEGNLPGPNDGHSWTWVGKCANPMRIAVNRGFGGTTGKPANVQLRVFESQIRTRGAGRRSILICLKQAPGLWPDPLSERP